MPTMFVLFDNPQTELWLLDNCFSLCYRFPAAKERNIKSMKNKTQCSPVIVSIQCSLILDRVKLKHNK